MQRHRTPRVTGEDGRDALALAERIQASLHAHRWNGDGTEFRGPNGMPTPKGKLFESRRRAIAAA